MILECGRSPNDLKDRYARWTESSRPRVLRFFPITRTSFPRRPAYLIAIPRSRYSSSLVIVL
jgi:hypothetical protein